MKSHEWAVLSDYKRGGFFSLRLVLQVVNLFLCLAVKRLLDQFIASNHRDVL